MLQTIGGRGGGRGGEREREREREDDSSLTKGGDARERYRGQVLDKHPALRDKKRTEKKDFKSCEMGMEKLPPLSLSPATGAASLQSQLSVMEQ